MSFVKSVDLVAMMKKDLQEIHLQHPKMTIIISLITQRGQWREGVSPRKITKARKFVNNVMATFVSSLNGGSVDHPQITYDTPGIFLPDNVNYTNQGNDIFLTNIANFLIEHLKRRWKALDKCIYLAVGIKEALIVTGNVSMM